jgi:hypothetical protein
LIARYQEGLDDPTLLELTDEIALLDSHISDEVGALDAIEADKKPAQWRELRKMLLERCTLVESQRKRLIEMQQLLTTKQALLFLGAITEVIRRHVSDRGTLGAITAEFERLAMGQPGIADGSVLRDTEADA